MKLTVFLKFQTIALFLVGLNSCSVYQSNSRKQFEGRASELGYAESNAVASTSFHQIERSPSLCRWLTPQDFSNLLQNEQQGEIFYSEIRQQHYYCPTSVLNSDTAG